MANAKRRPALVSVVAMRTITIEAAALACPNRYARNGVPLRDEGLIKYDAARHANVPEAVLFFGPYLPIEAGVYLFTFTGRLNGKLRIDFTYEMGQPLKETTIDSFADPICLVLTRRLTDFEIRGWKTPDLHSMSLEAVVVECVYSDDGG